MNVKDLLGEARSGEVFAIPLLLNLYGPRLRHAVQTRAPEASPEDVDVICSEVLVRAIENLGQIGVDQRVFEDWLNERLELTLNAASTDKGILKVKGNPPSRLELLEMMEEALTALRLANAPLQVLLRVQRMRASRAAEEVAQALKVSIEEFRRVEEGRTPLRSWPSERVAAWVIQVGLADEDAIRALARSLEIADAEKGVIGATADPSTFAHDEFFKKFVQAIRRDGSRSGEALTRR